MAASPTAAPYGWPIRPFGVQHLVTGNFGDPRGRAFHFGVDIRAAAGTPVYATLSGTVYARPRDPNVVGVDAGSTHHEYWHVVPSVTAGERAVAYRTVIGRIQPRFNHVHFTEIRRGVFRNPLRQGGLAPYVDKTSPSIREIVFQRSGRRLSARRLSGRVTVVADAFDWPALAREIPVADRNARVSPALVRWRLARRGRAVTRWRTAADFRRGIPPDSSFAEVYAPGTRQNRARIHGIFRFYLARGWQTSRLRNGRYELIVTATDIEGNQARARAALTIRN